MTSIKRNRKTKNEIIDKGDGTCEIILYDWKTQKSIGKAIIDAEDKQKCMLKKWFPLQEGYVVYKNRSEGQIFLHNYVLGRKANKKIIVDHINRRKKDNRKTNLRLCTQGLNQLNAKVEKRNKSGIPGVRAGYNGMWIAYIRFQYKLFHLGTFNKKEDAIYARKNAELKYFGTLRYEGE